MVEVRSLGNNVCNKIQPKYETHLGEHALRGKSPCRLISRGAMVTLKGRESVCTQGHPMALGPTVHHRAAAGEWGGGEGGAGGSREAGSTVGTAAAPPGLWGSMDYNLSTGRLRGIWRFFIPFQKALYSPLM